MDAFETAIRISARHIILLGCTKAKRQKELPAFLLYQASPWFRAMWKLALEQASDMMTDIYILSAKHGLVHPLTCIAPYEQELPGANAARTEWAAKVLNDLLPKVDVDQPTVFWFLAGGKYRSPLEQWLSAGSVNWLTFAPFKKIPGIQPQIHEAEDMRRALIACYGGPRSTLAFSDLARQHGG